MPTLGTVRGMRDFLPRDAEKLRYVEAVAKKTATLYGFEEVITPLVEHYDLLTAKSGEEIKKRMFAFDDLSGRRVALRPEFTASTARLMATTLRTEPKPTRLFSTGTLYRYDEPQFGRYREFWQSNFEIFGSSRPEADVEILCLTAHILRSLKLRGCIFKIGHVGMLRGLFSEEGVTDDQQNVLMQLLDKKRWRESLRTTRELGVSGSGLAALKKIFKTRGKDVTRMLSEIKKTLKDYASSVVAVENLQQILDIFSESRASVEIYIEARFARGLEYYTGMIFEPIVPELKISLGGGGRYDKLVELFKGEPTPAVGVAHGLDRIALAIDRQEIPLDYSRQAVAIIAINEETIPKAAEIATNLRDSGITVELEIMGRKIAKALQHADRRKTTHAVIVGSKELQKGTVALRNMKTHEQHLTRIEELSQEILRERL